MNLLVLGRGKTGSLVAEVARERGHEVRSVAAAENEGGRELTREKLKGVDVVLDFTTPRAVIANIEACVAAGANMVVGTTGWYDELPRLRKLVESSGVGFLYAPNFSIGVNVFFEIAREAGAALRQGYRASIVERHHAQKKDKPSGTAAKLQKILQDASGAQVEITSVREGDTVGTHVLLLDSGGDTMMLIHDAKSRRTFAEGAVRAAEWLNGKKGFYEFRQVLEG